jgi:hypothetical protein
MIKKWTLLLGGLFVFASCGHYVTLPKYTTVSKIYKLHEGMELNEINALLDLTPYDVRINMANNEKILVYKYKHSFQRVRGKYYEFERLNNTEKMEYYNESDIYIVLNAQNDKLKYYYTSAGLKSAKDLLKKENKILNQKN